MELPVEIWAIVISHASLADVSSLSGTSSGLRKEVTRYLISSPPTILEALTYDSVTLMRAASEIPTEESSVEGLVDFACEMKAWRVVVNFIAPGPLGFKLVCTNLIRGGFFGPAARIRRQYGGVLLDAYEHYVLMLYMHPNPETRATVLKNILHHCAHEQGSSTSTRVSRMTMYMKIAHSRDLPDLVAAALNSHYSLIALSDIPADRAREISRIRLQILLGKKR